MPAYKAYLLPYKPACDKVITNNTHVAEDIVRVSEAISQELRLDILPKRLGI